VNGCSGDEFAEVFDRRSADGDRRRYRAFAHPNAVVDALAAASGLRLAAESGTFIWRVAVFERQGG
jgi:hypothetical protein